MPDAKIQELKDQIILLETIMDDLSELLSEANTIIVDHVSDDELKTYITYSVKKFRKYKDYLNSDNSGKEVTLFLKMMKTLENYSDGKV